MRALWPCLIDCSAAPPTRAMPCAHCGTPSSRARARSIGTRDLIVGKQIGQIMSALGGRLGAYRAGASDPAAMEAALLRNLYRGEAPAPEALAHVLAEIAALRAALAAMPVAELDAADRLPA